MPRMNRSRSLVAACAALLAAVAIVACQDTFPSQLPLYDAASGDYDAAGGVIDVDGSDDEASAAEAGATTDAGDGSTAHDAGDAGSHDGGAHDGGDAALDAALDGSAD